MESKLRSTSFQCVNCGNVHTFYGKTANEIMKVNDIFSLSNVFRNHRYAGITSIIQHSVSCCKKPHLEWINNEVYVFGEAEK